MPSFDIVSKVDLQELDNSLNQASKELGQRYDFRGVDYELKFEKEKNQILLTASEEEKLHAMFDILSTRLVRRGIDLRSMDVGKPTAVGGKLIRQTVKIVQGLDDKKAKNVSKMIRDLGLKVDVQIQGEQLRVSGKKIDDLQAVIQKLKGEAASVGAPLQFINMRD